MTAEAGVQGSTNCSCALSPGGWAEPRACGGALPWGPGEGAPSISCPAPLFSIHCTASHGPSRFQLLFSSVWAAPGTSVRSPQDHPRFMILWKGLCTWSPLCSVPAKGHQAQAAWWPRGDMQRTPGQAPKSALPVHSAGHPYSSSNKGEHVKGC